MKQNDIQFDIKILTFPDCDTFRIIGYQTLIEKILMPLV